ncbi:MAG: TIGR02301 family protein [Rhizobiaceae bacterium]
MKLHTLRILLIALIGLSSPIGQSYAQTVDAPDPPYHQKLLRLSEVLGSVHFLRNLCGETGTAWRQSMSDLLVSEKPSPQRKAQLTASFNHGFRSFEGVYLRCTPSSIEALSRFMKEGQILSQEIATRYGN